jgi:hypothetical protein
MKSLNKVRQKPCRIQVALAEGSLLDRLECENDNDNENYK